MEQPVHILLLKINQACGHTRNTNRIEQHSSSRTGLSVTSRYTDGQENATFGAKNTNPHTAIPKPDQDFMRPLGNHSRRPDRQTDPSDEGRHAQPTRKGAEEGRKREGLEMQLSRKCRWSYFKSIPSNILNFVQSCFENMDLK